jgi:DNA-binding NarL/FixJ family response regulator
MKILLADDHPLFREALRAVIERVCPGASFSEASGYADVMSLTREDETFDLVFVDLMMPGGDDFSELARLRRRIPLTPTIVVSSRDDSPTVRRAMACGVAAYIPKSLSQAEMEAAIRRVLAGDIYVPAETREPHERPAAAGDENDELTPRQFAVLEQLARGSSNRQISHYLGIEEITVKAHISAILRKLGVKNRVQAVLVSRELLERRKSGSSL